MRCAQERSTAHAYIMLLLHPDQQSSWVRNAYNVYNCYSESNLLIFMHSTKQRRFQAVCVSLFDSSLLCASQSGKNLAVHT